MLSMTYDTFRSHNSHFPPGVDNPGYLRQDPDHGQTAGGDREDVSIRLNPQS